jgi:hypothetical protein
MKEGLRGVWLPNFNSLDPKKFNLTSLNYCMKIKMLLKGVRMFAVLQASRCIKNRG